MGCGRKEHDDDGGELYINFYTNSSLNPQAMINKQSQVVYRSDGTAIIEKRRSVLEIYSIFPPSLADNPARAILEHPPASLVPFKNRFLARGCTRHENMSQLDYICMEHGCVLGSWHNDHETDRSYLLAVACP